MLTFGIKYHFHICLLITGNTFKRSLNSKYNKKSENKSNKKRDKENTNKIHYFEKSITLQKWFDIFPP